MTALRPLFAWTLLALVAGGGVVGPSVHEAAHTLEAIESRTAHAADGYHGGDGASEECPTESHVDDCLACHVMPVAPSVRALEAAPAVAVSVDRVFPAVEAIVALPRGPTPVRGPPVA